MGMPITVEVLDPEVTEPVDRRRVAYFNYVDEKFSTYKETSEITQLNQSVLRFTTPASDMKLVFALAEQTKQETNGYFEHRSKSQL